MANITYFHKLHAKNFANKKIECFGWVNSQGLLAVPTGMQNLIKQTIT